MNITQQASGLYTIWGAAHKTTRRTLGQAIAFVRGMGCKPVLCL